MTLKKPIALDNKTTEHPTATITKERKERKEIKRLFTDNRKEG